MTEEEVLEQLLRTGALMKGHFILSSGLHSDAYVEKFRALQDPRLAKALGEALAKRFRRDSVEVVVSPAIGAIVLGFTTALALGARFIFAEREGGRMTLRRGFSVSPGEQTLIVEDVITTGASVMEVLELLSGGRAVGVGALVDRSSGLDLPVPLRALVRLEAAQWESRDCPLCARDIPATSPGSRHLGAGQGRPPGEVAL